MIALAGERKEKMKKSPAPKSLNMDEMTEEQIHEKLQKGLRDAELGRIQSAEKAFEEVRQKS